MVIPLKTMAQEFPELAGILSQPEIDQLQVANTCLTSSIIPAFI